jgi:hypothetical protein
VLVDENMTKVAGVNQQPPMHQLSMRPLKPFWGWTKHPPIPKLFGFFNLFSAPKFFPPTNLLPTYLPAPTYIPPPPYLTWLCAHFIAKAQEWLEQEPWQRAWSKLTNSIVRARERLKWDLGRSLKQDPDWELEAGPRTRGWSGPTKNCWAKCCSIRIET